MIPETSVKARSTRPTHRRGIGTAGVLILLVTLVVAAVVGLGLAVWLSGAELPGLADSGNHAQDQVKEPKYAYVTFGPILVNLAEGRLTRYLKVSLALQVDKQSADTVKETVGASRKAVFRNWLIIRLSDLKLEDVKGTSAVNRLRSEIKTGFNKLLSQYCEARVKDVLFEEFSIQ